MEKLANEVLNAIEEIKKKTDNGEKLTHKDNTILLIASFLEEETNGRK